MTQMNILDVINMVYPGQSELGNVTVGQGLDGKLFITKWTVPNLPQPTVEELEAMIPDLQKQFDLWYFVTIGQPQLMPYLDTVAQERQYDSAISCASYVSSTIPAWKAQADAFVSWRDSVFTYTIAQVQLMQSGERSVPTFEEFKTELPEMVWPS
jgi:hypothetical protein